MACLAALGGLALGCSDEPLEPQRLIASGQVMAADGVTPLAGFDVNRYELTFVVASERGEFEVARGFAKSSSGADIVTDEAGRFEIESDDLALAYTWEEDELVCGDVCARWETVCDVITEEICLDSCWGEDCWDECWDECTTECWDETVCDDEGCWIETVCEDSCYEVCDTVCQEVAYPCNCYTDSYEVCGDECVAVVEECNWVTRTYSAPASLDEVRSTHADIWVADLAGAEHVIGGDLLEAFQHQRCDAERRCENTSLWIQKDRFTIPFAR